MKAEEKKLSWKAWVSLLFLIVLLSGVFENIEGTFGFLKALDYQNLTGSFGEVVEGMTFAGQGGSGAKEGFITALTLIPGIIFVMGVIDVVEEMGAFEAAKKVFSPILMPLLGIPGACGIAFVSSFTSSDVGAIMTRQLYESGEITDNQRSIFAGYQYTASAVIANTISTQAALLPIIVLPVGAVIGLLFIFKLLAGNLIRVFLNRKSKKGVEANG